MAHTAATNASKICAPSEFGENGEIGRIPSRNVIGDAHDVFRELAMARADGSLPSLLTRHAEEPYWAYPRRQALLLRMKLA